MFAASLARPNPNERPHTVVYRCGAEPRREWGQNPGAVNAARHQKREQQTFARLLSRSRRCGTAATNINAGGEFWPESGIRDGGLGVAGARPKLWRAILQVAVELLELIDVRRGFLASPLDTFRAVGEVRFHRHARCSIEAIGFPGLAQDRVGE